MSHSHDDIIEQQLMEAEQLKLSAEHEGALEILEGILRTDPGNIIALEEIADNELSLGKYDRAVAAAMRVLSLSKESYTAYYILGFVASALERWKESIEHLQTANKLCSNNAEILRCLGWSLYSSGNEAAGIATLERALNLDDSNALILCDLGVVSLKLKDFTKAKSLFKRALDIDPANDRAEECLKMTEKIEEHVMEISKKS